MAVAKVIAVVAAVVVIALLRRDVLSLLCVVLFGR